MDADSAVVASFLEIVARARTELMRLDIGFRPKYGLRANSTFDCYMAGHMDWITGERTERPLVEFLIESKPKDRVTLGWFLEIEWPQGRWRVTHKVESFDDRGGELIQQFPDLEADTLEGLADILQKAVQDLVESVEPALKAVGWRPPEAAG